MNTVNKYHLVLILSSLALLSHSSAQLVIDAFAQVDPVSSSDWAVAGITEDLSAAAGGTIRTSGDVFNISGLTVEVSEKVSAFNGGLYPDSKMLSDYWFSFKTYRITLGGFDNKGIGKTMTSNLGKMKGNTFRLQPDSIYKLYLFGAGDGDKQYTTFTFLGESQTTSSSIQGTDADDGHAVVFVFKTDSDIEGITFEITIDRPGGAGNSAFNGLAIVPVSNPDQYQ